MSSYRRRNLNTAIFLQKAKKSISENFVKQLNIEDWKGKSYTELFNPLIYPYSTSHKIRFFNSQKYAIKHIKYFQKTDTKVKLDVFVEEDKSSSLWL